jgi:hypothetical protein
MAPLLVVFWAGNAGNGRATRCAPPCATQVRVLTSAMRAPPAGTRPGKPSD